ncbi:hypothetical protein SAMN04487936_11240 [Halobacillus dabanensis]|uniref:Uncharacterized protein n=1 Tax=Halobacillus dabanensis TaxID=240302 RepID=A0A1I3YWL0_HALDA|nr:hypothetical protein SAMN04487936_11240 [Halobacillus dabanensis]
MTPVGLAGQVRPCRALARGGSVPTPRKAIRFLEPLEYPDYLGIECSNTAIKFNNWRKMKPLTLSDSGFVLLHTIYKREQGEEDDDAPNDIFSNITAGEFALFPTVRIKGNFVTVCF